MLFRSPLEAASIGVGLGPEDAAYRCNLVTLRFDKQRIKAYMEDYSAGHITTGEAGQLIAELNGRLGGKGIAFYPGTSYRNLMVWSGGELDMECTPPHDITGKEISDYLPAGKGEAVLRELMRRSTGILEAHPVNRQRKQEGKPPANSIWLWGQGKKPVLPTFREKFGLKGAMVSAVDLMKGLGAYAGFEILDVPGVTGWLDTNYAGKAEYSLKALEKADFVFIHVEAPDEASHAGKLHDKIKAIEDFDALVVGTVLRGVKAFDEWKVLLLPDHATPIEAKTHTDEPVPFVIYGSGPKRLNEDATFDEGIARRKDITVIEEGHRLMEFFLARK